MKHSLVGYFYKCGRHIIELNPNANACRPHLQPILLLRLRPDIELGSRLRPRTMTATPPRPAACPPTSTAVVNFTNILQAAFVTISFR